MSEYQGRINLSKEEMLFVVNGIFEADVKESTTKEALLKIVTPFYGKENYEKILKMLPYEAYKALEKLLKYVDKHESDDIREFFKENDFRGCHELEKALIIVLRAKYGEYSYSVNKEALKDIKDLFTEKNRSIANRYGLMERLIIGLLYTYGVVNLEFFRKELSRHMKEIISYDEIFDIIYYRLNLNPMVETRTIHWNNIDEEDTLITYLEYEVENFEQVVSIFMEQKAREWDYKLFSKKELLKREEYLWDENAKKLSDFMAQKDRCFFEFTMKRYIKDVELGNNVLEELMNRCKFIKEDEIEEFMELFMQWYNNTSQYELCGYTPIELAQKMQ